MTKVRSARLRHNTPWFCQKSIKDSPTSIASLRHIVALNHMLSWKLSWIFTGRIFQSGFKCLNKAHSIAWTTASLVSYFACKVISFNIAQIKVCWNLIIRNFLRCIVFLSVLRLFFKNFCEVVSFSEFKLSYTIDLLFQWVHWWIFVPISFTLILIYDLD